MTTALVKPEATATTTVASPVVNDPARHETVYFWRFDGKNGTFHYPVTVYTQGFEGGTTDSWATTESGVYNFPNATTGFPAQSGTRVLALACADDGVAPNWEGVATRTVTGLEVGRAYTFTAYGRRQNGNAGNGIRIGVTGVGASPWQTTVGSWLPFSFTFTATATSHQLFVEASSNSNYSYWDNVVLARSGYFDGPNDGLDGWTAGTGHTALVDDVANNPAMNVYGGVGTVEAQRTFTGLVSGHSYSVRAKVSSYANFAPDDAWIGVVGKATGAVVLTDNDNQIQMMATYTFTATASSHVVELAGAAGSDLMWDDIVVIHHVPATYTTTPELTITEGKVTVADDWSPYIQATFDVPLTGLDLLEQIDPKNNQRVTVQAQEGIGGTSRSFDLGLRVREVDHGAKKITMELASDEALLMDRKNVSATVDTTPRTHAASLRAICNWALGKIGASLEAGTDDANLTPYWPLTNLMPNPDMDANVTGYTAGTGCTIAHNTGADSGGSTGFLRATLSATSATIYLAPTNSGATSGYTVTPGRTYAITAAVRQNVAGGSFAMYLRYVDAAGNQIGTSTSTLWTLATTFGSTRYTTIATAPAGAAKAHPYISVSGSATGRTVDVDRVTLVEDNEAPTYFDGSTTQTGYTMAWTDTTNASTSNRTPTVDRPRELLYWKPGQSLWDFLTPLVERAGLRLFCDEHRDWRLVNPDTYDVPGYVVVQEKHNATRGTDKITRNDDTWADAVVCIYEWDDANGIRRTAYDFAGSTTGKCVTFTYDRPFPGPGAAAYALGRLQGTGRTQDVTCLTQYSATPGQDVTINLPGTLSQTGTIREVIFDLRTGLMDLGTRGLADALPGSWALWNPSQTWSAVSPTLLWKDA